MTADFFKRETYVLESFCKLQSDFLCKTSVIDLGIIMQSVLMSVWLWNFKDGGSQNARFLPKNQHALK